MQVSIDIGDTRPIYVQIMDEVRRALVVGTLRIPDVDANEARKERVVVAHELTEHTRRALKAGIVDAIIHQDAGHEVRSALRILKAHIDKTTVLAAQETIRIEIYLNENLP